MNDKMNRKSILIENDTVVSANSRAIDPATGRTGEEHDDIRYILWFSDRSGRSIIFLYIGQ